MASKEPGPKWSSTKDRPKLIGSKLASLPDIRLGVVVDSKMIISGAVATLVAVVPT